MALQNKFKNNVNAEETEVKEVVYKEEKKSIRQNMMESSGGKRKKERFLRIKMWISFFVSMTMKDRGKIPDNIEDRILITNNLYITKLYLTSIIHIQELGSGTVQTLLEVLNAQLRDRECKCILDCTIKNVKYTYDRKNSGLQSRIRGWENAIDSDMSTKRMQRRAATCLYTVSVAESGKQLKESRIYLSIRAKEVTELNAGEKIIFDALAQMDCTYLPVYNNIKETMEYISIIGNHKPDLKGVTSVFTSNEVLSQLLPNCASINDRKGIYVGENILNGSPYYLDVASITVARNMYVCAPSGVGKTVLAVNMGQSAYEEGSACCFMDIKGNEYTNFINATNGYIVSLRPTSTEYINSFIMYKEECKDFNKSELYFKSRVNFSKQQFLITSGLRDREKLVELEELIDEFLEALYISIGATPDNVNSWVNTMHLTPYVVFDSFVKYFNPKKMSEYTLGKNIVGILRMYWSKTGSKSYVFSREFQYSKILNASTISFDFGMLANQEVSDVDMDLFRLKFHYMSYLNDSFVTKKHAEGKRTFKVLEESQVVTDEIMQMYVREYTLRRSQNQDTLLLGNSAQALMDNKIAKPLVENTRALFIGELTKDARDKVVEQFGLQHLDKLCRVPGSAPRYKNSFLFINNMQDKEIYPIIKVVMRKDLEEKYKVLVPVKQNDLLAGG